jgi:hypothetical protein
MLLKSTHPTCSSRRLPVWCSTVVTEHQPLIPLPALCPARRTLPTCAASALTAIAIGGYSIAACSIVLLQHLAWSFWPFQACQLNV